MDKCIKGIIVVIDGMDGTGKKTQSDLLLKKIKTEFPGVKAELVSFPNYNNRSSYFVKRFLKEGYCKDANPYLLDSFFAIDRAITFEQELRKKYEGGYFLILDRYTLSNAIYRMDKFDDKDQSEYLSNLSYMEHDILNLPKPDINIILHSLPEVNMQLIDNRCKIDHIEKDINENKEVQTKVFNNIQNIVVNTNDDLFGPINLLSIHDSENELYSKEEISNRIYQLVFDMLQKYI